MKEKYLISLLTDCLNQKKSGTMSSHEFVSMRGKIRQLCHKYSYKFPEIERAAKKAA